MNRYMKMIIPLLLTTCNFSSYFITNYKIDEIKENKLVTYAEGIKAVDYALSGFDKIKNNDNLSVKVSYQLNALGVLSSYMATKEEKYLKYAKDGADKLSYCISDLGLIINENNIDEFNTVSGANGQASAVIRLSYLSRFDNNYIPLMEELADALNKYCINKHNNLVWYKVNSTTGLPINDENYGYEAQLGSISLTVAQSLLAAYETNPEKVEYRDTAIKIISAVWERRDKDTNLISESWDILNDKPGSKLYPYADFRYDDMGGVYIRTLMFAYNLTSDNNLFDILKVYTPALVKGIWDPSINGGAFRYLNTVKGQSSSKPMVETMYGVFTATLLEANRLINNKYIYDKCVEHANNIFINNFGIKNNMVPHAINSDGSYVNQNNDSQLGYAVIQFPLGYNMLSNISGKSEYRIKSNEIMSTLLERHKVINNDAVEDGYASIIETQPPYGFESSYSKVVWMSQITYLPSYLLYNSIQTSKDISIDWGVGYSPNVFGLASDMPFWDVDKVSFDINTKTLILKNVSGDGTINLEDMGFGKISEVYIDGNLYTDFNNNNVKTQFGTHSYVIKW